MKLLVAVIAVTITVFNGIVLGGHHEAVFKSVRRADHECTLHLKDGTCGQGECSVRCRGLVTRFWNDTLGFPAVTINRFYLPKPYNYKYYELTDKCLNQVAATYSLEDSCGRADYTVQCYNDQYGQLDKETPKFVPFTDLQHRRILHECMAILRISPERLFLFKSNGIEHYQDAKCLLRCFMLREGYYTDEEGPHFPRMSLQCKGNYNDEVFRNKAKSCISKLQDQCLDRCSLAYQIADECVNGEIAVMSIFTGQIAEPNVSDLQSLLPIPPFTLPTLIPPLPTLPTILPRITLPRFTIPTLFPIRVTVQLFPTPAPSG